MIEVSHVAKSFGGVKALKDISFKVSRGHIVGFLGANGAGKTTTMDILCGCLGPDQGSVKIGEFDVLEDPIRAKAMIGYLPDEPPLYNDMKVAEFLHYSAAIRGVPRKGIASRVSLVSEQLDIANVADRLIGNLSKGYRQRVALGQAMIHDPDVLVLDEPTEGLDPNQIVQIRALIKDLAKNHTILFSSHILSEVESLCDQLIIIDQGSIIRQGTCDEIMAEKGATRYQLAVRDNSAEAMAMIKFIQGIGDLNRDGDLIQFTLADEGAVDTLLKSVLASGFGIKSFTPVHKSLEEHFREITSEHTREVVQHV